MARVAFVGVDVNFQLGRLVGSNKQVFEGDAASWTLNRQLHEVAVLDAVVAAVIKVHMDVPRGANHTAVELHRTSRADQDTAGGAFDITAMPSRSIDAQRDRIGQRQLDLTVRTCRSENPHAG